MNPFFLTDGYKTGHHVMYPVGTTLVYSNFTPRSNKYAPKGMDKVVVFGTQMTFQQIHESFENDFFKQDRTEILDEIRREYSTYLGFEYDVSHIAELYNLGYLPIEIKALPEGTLSPMGVPVLTIKNTLPQFYWLPNFLETIVSNLLWKPMTSATIAHQYRKNLLKWIELTDKDNVGFVDFQGHDFSMRGLDSKDATISSGLGHATSFLGSDSLPAIYGARKYYDSTEPVIHSVNATEHSVMCAGGKEDELKTFRRLMKTFPEGILSVVSDTWDLWNVLTVILPQLKDEIMARDGKLVIRPDSGDPVDIICGIEQNIVYKDTINIDEHISWTFIDNGHGFPAKYLVHKSKTYRILPSKKISNYVYFVEENLKVEQKGVIELLWDLFGGTVNNQGYKVLDPHIGAIYGDSITLDRAEEICKRLEAKGFASTNIVLGIGSFTYQYNTRDTFSFAVKATYVEIEETVLCSDGKTIPSECTHDLCKEHNGCSADFGQATRKIVGREIFKDPVTDDGTKKSAKGLLMVQKNETTGDYEVIDQVSWKEEEQGELKTIYKDGGFISRVSFEEIRNRLKKWN